MQGWEAVGRLRVSAGLEVDKLQGGFRRRTPTDLDFPAISCDSALTARLRYEDRLPEGKEAYAQFALLYTTPEGGRRIRVHTLGLPVAAKLTHVFKGADLDAQLTALARAVADKVPPSRQHAPGAYALGLVYKWAALTLLAPSDSGSSVAPEASSWTRPAQVFSPSEPE